MVFIEKKAIFFYNSPKKAFIDPLLFLIYVNDIQKCLKFSDPIMFADDTNVFYTK